MITQTEIDRLCAIPMAQFLATRGHMPVHQNGIQLQYSSPLRQEKDASFWVHTGKNVFKDFGVTEHRGSLIRLVQLLDRCSFLQAVEKLRTLDLSQTETCFFPNDSSGSTLAKEKILSSKLLANPVLVRYAESRGISYPIARKYLREVYYQHNDRRYFALGFANDRDGYALSDANRYKRTIGPAWYTTIPAENTGKINLFEGFFDFLSALEYYRLTVPGSPTYVLNSLSNLPALLETLSRDTTINAYLDRDRAGRDAVEKLRSCGYTVNDRSSIYARKKDFNDYINNNQNAD